MIRRTHWIFILSPAAQGAALAGQYLAQGIAGTFGALHGEIQSTTMLAARKENLRTANVCTCPACTSTASPSPIPPPPPSRGVN